MGSVSSEDEGSDKQSERCGSYSLSADVSESESCCSFSCRRFDVEGASTSLISSPRPVAGNFRFQEPVMLPVVGGKDVVSWDEKPEKRDADLSEIDMMKERFSKLLLGEDMSGGGKGVCTALAISNAITNLSATVFGDLWRLEPVSPQKKAMWDREMEYLLSISDFIVELVPSIQQFPGGGTYEVMATRPRSDLHMNLPALKKLDTMLLSMLDGFCETEFWYVESGIGRSGSNGDNRFMLGGRQSMQQEEKWWLPCPKVSPNGLSANTRNGLQQCRDCANQIWKAAMTINSNVLAEMEIPEVYLENLPKSGKACLGDIMYRHIKAAKFSPEYLLDCLDLSSEHLTLDVANMIEGSIHVWKQKDQKMIDNRIKGRGKSWGGKVKGVVSDLSKNLFLAQRAETLLRSLRLRFPALPQTALDMTKIQYNKDVGQSILESYSRVMESLAFNIMARTDDVLFVDDAMKRCAEAESISLFSRGSLGGLSIQKFLSPSPFSVQHTSYASPFATPTFSSTPVIASPGRVSSFPKNQVKKAADSQKFWSYAGNLSGRRISGVTPERD